ncbi:MAG TPA: urate oxidase [Vicinamibacterales bacterium]|nr:urate oxidase [Vicinamibacterales bacterium]
MLAESAYGKSSVRLLKVSRHGDRHDLTDFHVAIRFEGDYAAAYLDGDNSGVLPTDTMKNTVYALAATSSVTDPEAFGLLLSDHFLRRNPRLDRVRIDISEHPWGRIPVGDREHGQAFVRRGAEVRSATVRQNRSTTAVDAGVADLLILKSSRSAFTGFLRDEYTTLPDAADRLLATSLTATWRYRDTAVEFGQAWRAVRTTLLETFAEHDSRSVQHTLYAMGEAVLAAVDAVASVRLVMPNKHHLPIDLARLGLENRNEVFVPTDEPYGLIEATLVR